MPRMNRVDEAIQRAKYVVAHGGVTTNEVRNMARDVVALLDVTAECGWPMPRPANPSGNGPAAAVFWESLPGELLTPDEARAIGVALLRAAEQSEINASGG